MFSADRYQKLFNNDLMDFFYPFYLEISGTNDDDELWILDEKAKQKDEKEKKLKSLIHAINGFLKTSWSKR